MVHDRHAQIEDDLLAGPRHDELPDAVQDGPHEQDGDEDDDELIQYPGLLETEIEHALDDLGPYEAERGRDQKQRRRDREVPLVRTDETQEPAVHRDRGSLLGRVAALAPHEHVSATAARNHHFLNANGRCQGRSHTMPKYSIPLGATRRAVAAAGRSAKRSGTRRASVRAIFETCLYSSARLLGSASVRAFRTSPTIRGADGSSVP